MKKRMMSVMEFFQTLQAGSGFVAKGLAIAGLLFVSGCGDQTPAVTRPPELVIQEGNMSDCVISPDGKLMATSGKLWDIQSGRMLYSIEDNNIACFSPDSTRVATLNSRNEIGIWDIASRKCLHTLTGHTSPVAEIRFSPDGLILASASRREHDNAPYSDVIRFWDMQSGSLICSTKDITNCDDRMTPYVCSIDFSPDGRELVAGYDYDDKNIRIWDTRTGVMKRKLSGHRERVSAVAWSGDERSIISGSYDKTIRRWDASSGRSIGSPLDCPGWVEKLVFSPDGTCLAAEIRNYPEVRYQLRHPVTLKVMRELPLFEGFFPDGERIVYCRSDVIRCHDINRETYWPIWAFKQRNIETTRFAQDEQVVFSGSYVSRPEYNAVIKTLDFDLGKVADVWNECGTGVSLFALSPDAALVASVKTDSPDTITLLDVKSRQIKHRLMAGAYVDELLFSHDHSLVFAVVSKDDNNALKVWDTDSGSLKQSVMLYEQGNTEGCGVSNFLLSSDDRCFIFSSSEVEPDPDPEYRGVYHSRLTIKSLDVVSGKLNSEFRTDEFSHSLAVSADARFIAAGGHAGSLRIWDYQTGKLIHEILNDGVAVRSLAFSPDGKLLAGALQSDELRIWNTSSWKLSQTLKTNADSLSFNRENTLLCAESQGRIKVWNVKTGKMVMTFVDFVDDEWIGFSPEGFYTSTFDAADRVRWFFQGFGTADFAQFKSVFSCTSLDEVIEKSARNPQKILPPPVVTLEKEYQSIKTDNDIFDLSMRVRDQNKVKNLRIFVNGRFAEEKSLAKSDQTLTCTVPLTERYNRITAIAFNDAGFSSYPVYLDVESGSAAIRKPDLHVVSIGVSRYPHLSDAYQLDLAHKDATDLADAFMVKKSPLYDEIHAITLTDDAATPGRILEALDSLRSASVEDTAVIYFSGHGVRSDETGDYYYLTYDCSLTNLTKEGLNWEQLYTRLSALKCRVILLLDTCHSGAMSTETIVPSDEFVSRLMSQERSGVVILSASKGRQASYEALQLGNGFFTAAFLESIDLKSRSSIGEDTRNLASDKNNDGVITFSELSDFVVLRVFDMTGGLQTPRLARQEIQGDFPFWKVTDTRN